MFDDDRKKQKSTYLNDYELDLTFQKKICDREKKRKRKRKNRESKLISTRNV